MENEKLTGEFIYIYIYIYSCLRYIFFFLFVLFYRYDSFIRVIQFPIRIGLKIFGQFSSMSLSSSWKLEAKTKLKRVSNRLLV